MRVRLMVVMVVLLAGVLAGCGSKRGMYRDQLDSNERLYQARFQAEQAKAVATAAPATECAKKTDSVALLACMMGVSNLALAQQVGNAGQQQPITLPTPPRTMGDKLFDAAVGLAPTLVNGAVAWRQSDNQVDITDSNNATQQALYAGAFGAAGTAVAAMRDASAANAASNAAVGTANAQAMADVANGAVAGNVAAVQSIASVLPELAPEINTTTNVGRDQVTVTGDENETSTGQRAGNDLASITGDGNETRQNSSGPNPGGTVNCLPGNAGNGGNGGNAGNGGGTTGPGGSGGAGAGGGNNGTDCGSAPGGG